MNGASNLRRALSLLASAATIAAGMNSLSLPLRASTLKSTSIGMTASPGLTRGASSKNVTFALSGPVQAANDGTGATTQVGAPANSTGAIWVDGVTYPRTAAGIQKAINAAPQGGTVYLSTGVFVFGPSDTCITITKPVNVLGMGYGSQIQVAGSVKGNIDIFCVKPTVQGDSIRFADFSLLAVSGTPARYAFNIDGATAAVSNFSIERVSIRHSFGSYAIYAHGTGARQGTPSLARITHNALAGGFAMTNCGDTVRVEDNTISGAGNIDINFQSGASTFIFRGNNVSVLGGMHIGTSAVAVHIEDNEFETEAGFIGSNGAVVDIDGISGSLKTYAMSTIVDRNSIQVVNGVTVSGIRVNFANDTEISGNNFERGATSKDILITANAKNTIVGTNMWLSGPPYASMVSNSGTGTSCMTQYVGLNSSASCSMPDPMTVRAGVVNQSGTSGGSLSVSGCGVTATLGNSLAGAVRSSTTGACTLTITPGFTAPHGFTCFVNDETSASTFRQTAHTATGSTLSGTTVAGDVVTFACQPF